MYHGRNKSIKKLIIKKNVKRKEYNHILENITDINIYKTKEKHNKIITYILPKLIIVINLFIEVRPNTKFFESYFSNITLKIKGIGYKYIFGHEINKTFLRANFPNEIFY